MYNGTITDKAPPDVHSQFMVQFQVMLYNIPNALVILGKYNAKVGVYDLADDLRSGTIC